MATKTKTKSKTQTPAQKAAATRKRNAKAKLSKLQVGAVSPSVLKGVTIGSVGAALGAAAYKIFAL